MPRWSHHALHTWHLPSLQHASHTIGSYLTIPHRWHLQATLLSHSLMPRDSVTGALYIPWLASHSRPSTPATSCISALLRRTQYRRQHTSESHSGHCPPFAMPIHADQDPSFTSGSWILPSFCQRCCILAQHVQGHWRILPLLLDLHPIRKAGSCQANVITSHSNSSMAICLPRHICIRAQTVPNHSGPLQWLLRVGRTSQHPINYHHQSY